MVRGRLGNRGGSRIEPRFPLAFPVEWSPAPGRASAPPGFDLPETSPLLVAVHRNGVLLYANRELAELLNLDHPAELLGRRLEELVHPDERDRVRRALAQLVEGSPPHTIEEPITLATGSVVTLDLSSTPIVWAGAPARVLVGIDVTHSAQARKDLIESERLLRAEEDRFHKVFEASPVAISISTLAEGRFIDVNPTFAEMSGYTRVEIVGRKSSDLGLWRDPAARGHLIDHLRRHSVVRNVDIEYRTKDGRSGTALGSLVRAEFGGEECVLALLVDITERNKAERRLRLLQDVAVALAESEDLTAALIHVLREMCALADWRYGECWLPSPDGERLVLGAAWDGGDPALARFHRTNRHLTFHPGEGLPGRVWSLGSSLWIPDLAWWGRDSESEGWHEYASDAMAVGLRSAVGVPALAGAEVAAVLVFHLAHPRERDSELVELVAAAAAQLGAVVRRRHAEEALEEEERVLSRVLDTTEEGILIVRNDGRVSYANPAAGRILGRLGLSDNDPDLTRVTWREVDGRDADPAEPVPLRAAREGKTTRHAIQEVDLPDGGRVVLSINAAPIEMVPGTWSAVVCLRDVTEQRRAEEAIRKAFVLHPLPVSIVTLEEGRIVEVNRAFERVYGYAREEVVGKREADLDLWVNLHDRDEIVARVRQDAPTPEFEVQLRPRSGAVLDVLLSAERLVLDEVECMLVVARDVTRHKRRERELRHQSLYDPLTGLANRLLFQDRIRHALSRARRESRVVAVLVVDLKRFQQVNDSLGHAAGDRLLVTVARRLDAGLRELDTVARLGGDEFGILIEDVIDVEHARTSAERILRVFEAPFTTRGTRVHLSATVGIALSSPRVLVPEDLIRYADIAAHRAGGEQGSSLRVFEPELDAAAAESIYLENDLRAALSDGGLRLHYQPIVSLMTGRIHGAEALLRWEHPQRGLLTAAEFVPLAEESGLVLPLGDWVVHEAIRQLQAWIDAGTIDPDFRLSFNLSPRYFRRAGLLDLFTNLLRDAAVPPERFQIEITETVALTHPETIEDLRRQGLRVAIDDLGTGYASLESLARLEVDLLKIDRAFIGGLIEYPRDDAIVEALVLLARRLGIPIVAEGVETMTQLKRLRELGCGFAQGYFFSKPLDRAIFEELLARSPRW